MHPLIEFTGLLNCLSLLQCIRFARRVDKGLRRVNYTFSMLSVVLSCRTWNTVLDRGSRSDRPRYYVTTPTRSGHWPLTLAYDLDFQSQASCDPYVRTDGRTDGRTFETHFIRSNQKSRPNNNKVQICISQNKKFCDALVQTRKLVDLWVSGKRCNSQRHDSEVCRHHQRILVDCTEDCEVCGADYCSCSSANQRPCIGRPRKSNLVECSRTPKMTHQCVVSS